MNSRHGMQVGRQKPHVPQVPNAAPDTHSEAIVAPRAQSPVKLVLSSSPQHQHHRRSVSDPLTDSIIAGSQKTVVVRHMPTLGRLLIIVHDACAACHDLNQCPLAGHLSERCAGELGRQFGWGHGCSSGACAAAMEAKVCLLPSCLALLLVHTLNASMNGAELTAEAHSQQRGKCGGPGYHGGDTQDVCR